MKNLSLFNNWLEKHLGLGLFILALTLSASTCDNPSGKSAADSGSLTDSLDMENDGDTSEPEMKMPIIDSMDMEQSSEKMDSMPEPVREDMTSPPKKEEGTPKEMPKHKGPEQEKIDSLKNLKSKKKGGG